MSQMEKEPSFMSASPMLLLLLFIWFAWFFYISPCTRANKADSFEKEIYKCTALINEKPFEGVTNKAEGSQILTVYPNTEYPGDKIVVINNKSVGELWVYVENNDGLAKVVDVELDGKQVSFR